MILPVPHGEVPGGLSKVSGCPPAVDSGPGNRLVCRWCPGLLARLLSLWRKRKRSSGMSRALGLRDPHGLCDHRQSLLPASIARAAFEESFQVCPAPAQVPLPSLLGLGVFCPQLDNLLTGGMQRWGEFLRGLFFAHSSSSGKDDCCSRSLPGGSVGLSL